MVKRLINSCNQQKNNTTENTYNILFNNKIVLNIVSIFISLCDNLINQ